MYQYKKQYKKQDKIDDKKQDKKQDKIEDLNSIKNIVQREKLKISVICYGGCCSNQLVDIFEQNNYKSKSPVWDTILCHCPHYIDIDIPIIYLYDNPIKAYLSMKRRYVNVVNQKKLSNNKNSAPSDETLLQLMIKQFHSFTNQPRKNVLIVKACDLFQPAICDKLKNFLNNPNLNYFPIEYIPGKTNMNEISAVDAALFLKYKAYIDYINNWKPL